MKQVEQLAEFVREASFADLSKDAVEQLKIRVLDSLGCAIGALSAPPIQEIRQVFQHIETSECCTMIGNGNGAPDRAAFYNGALIRYLDFNDSYLAKGETCHPSDNLSAILAAGEAHGCHGSEFLTALAISYQVQCRLSDEAPVRARGFDHTVQGAYGAAAGVAKAMGLNRDQIANALAISGVTNNALRVTRTGSLSNWKGLAGPYAAFAATHAALLASAGITGPLEVFEGKKGFKEVISGPFFIDWERESLEKVRRTILKKYNAEVHSQSVLEGILALRTEYQLEADLVETVEIEIFDVAYHIIGGGEEGEKKTIRTKEQADHSLPYLVAVALLDGQVMPEQYDPARILQHDVQQLLQRVHVQPSIALSRRFPIEIPCRITVLLKNREKITLEKSDYEGFYTNPMSITGIWEKFARLTRRPFIDESLQKRIFETVMQLEELPLQELSQTLALLPPAVIYPQEVTS